MFIVEYTVTSPLHLPLALLFRPQCVILLLGIRVTLCEAKYSTYIYIYIYVSIIKHERFIILLGNTYRLSLRVTNRAMVCRGCWCPNVGSTGRPQVFFRSLSLIDFHYRPSTLKIYYWLLTLGWFHRLSTATIPTLSIFHPVGYLHDMWAKYRVNNTQHISRNVGCRWRQSLQHKLWSKNRLCTW